MAEIKQAVRHIQQNRVTHGINKYTVNNTVDKKNIYIYTVWANEVR